MAEPRATPEQLAERLTGVLAEASGEVTSTDWAAHDAAINAIMDSTTLFYLRTDPATGLEVDRVIWPKVATNPPDASRLFERFNYGCIAALVEPLVQTLREQTDAITPLVKVIPGASEDAAWGHWLERLAHYEQALAEVQGEKRNVPSMFVFTNVTAPLLLGYFPASFQAYGVAAAGKGKSRPDVTWTATTAFQVALSSAARQQSWAAFWGDLGDRAITVGKSLVKLPVKVIEKSADIAKGVAQGVSKGARTVGLVAALGLAGYVAIRASKE